MSLPLLITLLAACGRPLDLGADRDARRPSFRELHIPEVTGPPAAPTCTEARAAADPTTPHRARSPRELEAASRPTLVEPPPPESEPTAQQRTLPPPERADDDPHGLLPLPGDIPSPEALPLQPLEGAGADRVAAVLRRAADGERVRISVIGASHTSGDWFTGQLRRRLQAAWGDLGHGFIHPAALYTGYRGHDINLCRSDGWRSDWAGRKGGRGDGLLGFSGASVSSTHPADFGWLETTHTNVRGRRVSRFDIFTLGQPRGGALLATVDDAPARRLRTRAPSASLLHHRLTVPDGGHRLTLSPAGDGEVRILGVSAEREGPGVLVDAIGVRGQQARAMLRWDSEMLRLGLQALGTDLLVLAFGTNEANDTNYDMTRYRRDLWTVLQQTRAALPDAACLLIGPSDRVKRTDAGPLWYPRVAAVAAVQREVSSAAGCAFWDWQAATGGPGSMLTWRTHDPPLAGRDLIHFTRDGYALSADRLLDALLDAAERELPAEVSASRGAGRR